MGTGRTMVIVGACMLVLGALLPWGVIEMGFGSRNITGITGDGIFSFFAGIGLLIGGLAVKGKPGHIYSAMLGLFGLMTTIFMCAKTYSLVQVALTGDSAGMIGVGSGLWISLAGAVLVFVGGTIKVPEQTA